MTFKMKQFSLQNKLVTVFGGNGFLGKYVVQALLKRGARVRVASRNPERSFSLQPMAKLGQLQAVQCDITNAKQMEAQVKGSDHIINLVGDFSGNLLNLMGAVPGAMAKLAIEADVRSFVHVSAIGSDAKSSVAYASSKAKGEDEVLKHFPTATIIKPSIIFGEDDNFINLFAGLIQLMPALPVFAPHTKLQLTFVDDVAVAIVNSLESPDKFGGKIYELGGPEALTMMQINQLIADAQKRKRIFVPIPDTISAVFASLPLTPMTRDQWALLKPGNTVSEGHPGYTQLGIKPRPLSLFLPKWMVRYRRSGRFNNDAPKSN